MAVQILENVSIIRSNRRTIGIEIKKDGAVLVRAPYVMSDREIRIFVAEHEQWIATHLNMVKERLEKQAACDTPRGMSRQELEELAQKALEFIPKRVAHFAPLIGVTYGRITIRNQRTRWGSCSQKGNLNFNCALMLAPREVLDSVVVHELCHRKEMNHSQRFYQEVLRVFPDYWKWHGWLKEHGEELLQRTALNPEM